MGNILARIPWLLALVLLAPWPVAYAFDAAQPAAQAIPVQAAEPSAQPSARVFGQTIGGFEPGDLFLIDASVFQADIMATVYLTNAAELARHYRYLIMKINPYARDAAGTWKKARRSDGAEKDEALIGLRNAQASFQLAGGGSHKIRVDGGSYYCTDASGGGLAPQFYLEAE